MNRIFTPQSYTCGAEDGELFVAYRYYRFDGTGRIREAEWLDAVDDDDAVRQVRERNLPVPSEVWERNRRVARIEPSGRG